MRHPSAREILLQGHRCGYRCGPVTVPKSAQHSVEFAVESSDIRVWDHSRTHKDTPALPFCHLVLTARKPKDSAYPKFLETLGDRLRAKRMDLGLYQKQVAKLLGVTEDTICYWEKGRVEPSRKQRPKIVKFLAGD
jgi:DNA-binding XRE family transcriptional regulator